MKRRLKISVSDKPNINSEMEFRRLSIRKRLLDKLLGPKQQVTIIVPGQTVDSIAISDVNEGGVCSE